jgi:hypothetical protein
LTRLPFNYRLSRVLFPDVGRAVLNRTTRLQNANKAVIRSFPQLKFAGAAAAKGGQFYTDSHFVVGALAEGYCQLSDCFGANRNIRRSKGLAPESHIYRSTQ